MVDRNVVLRKITDLETYLQQIEEFRSVTAGEYRSDWKVQRIVERTLQMMIEVCSDIANHVIADAGMRPPTSYADTFRVLHENAVIDEQLTSALEKMARFRNIIVHQYETIDAEIIEQILTRNLQDFAAFRDQIQAHIVPP